MCVYGNTFYFLTVGYEMKHSYPSTMSSKGYFNKSTLKTRNIIQILGKE